ncbi:MAG: LysR family transcriptional regulator [Bacteroidota bacterium]
MDISIQHLKLVNVVVKEGSITKAAEKLCLSQPALSHQLKTLEEKIDLKVFNRIHKKLVLTEAGNLLFQTSEKLLTSMHKLDRQLQEIRGGTKKTIRLSTECYTTYHWLPGVVNDFKKEHSEVRIQIVIEATKSPIQYLLDGLIDLAILSKTVNDPSIQFEQLVQDEMVAIVSKDNPLAVQKEIDLKDLGSENLILYDVSDDKNYVLNNILKKNTELVHSIQKVQLTEAIIQLVRANLGISIMAKWALEPITNDEGLQIIPLRGNIGNRTWYIASLNKISSIERLFINKVKNIFNLSAQ